VAAARQFRTAQAPSVFFGELDEPRAEGQRLVCALAPELVWLSHEHEPWRPQVGRGGN
jgi:N-acyl homoserine lactone hydrolase